MHLSLTAARLTACFALFLTTAACNGRLEPVAAGTTPPAVGPALVEPARAGGDFRVLAPIQSGELTLFPVVLNRGNSPAAGQFLTLDEGLRSGEVEVTEYGKVRGLARSRNGYPSLESQSYGVDQVHTLMLLNHSKRPLLLLAGEIVTGGKQDRIIAKDRIVAPGADPIDLSVFCVEHGRWTESSAKFGASAEAQKSFMVQPEVRRQAMVAKDQQGVWDAVAGAVDKMARASAPAAMPGRPIPAPRSLGTTSYAKAMQAPTVNAVIDKESAGILQSREQAGTTLRDEHAIGVVVAIRGEIIWADLFSDPDLLACYWIKLVRSYAAEGLGSGYPHRAATLEDAQSFLDAPAQGREESEGESGVYRVREVKANTTDTIALESLLPGTGFDVHTSRLKLPGDPMSVRGGVAPPVVYPHLR